MPRKNLKKYQSYKKTEKKVALSRKIKIILAAVCLCAAALILYFAVPAVIGLFDKKPPEVPQKIKFYPIVEGEDITKDAAYMDLDRNFYYEDPSYGLTVSFDTQTLAEIPEEYRPPVELLVRYIMAALEGSEADITELYSEQFQKNGFVPKTGFTPQKLYETKFTQVSRTTVEEELGTWSQWTFWVEYKIYKNNGTFRDDMGSNCTRRELFVITYRDGKMEIDAVQPYRTEN